MSTSELIVSRESEPVVALGMTSAAFDSAQRAGVTHIEADTDAIAYIARHVGYAESSAGIPPLVVVARDSSDTRSLIGRWDDRLPSHQGEPNTGRFFPANHLDKAMPPSGNREVFADFAKHIGAPALTEVSVASWEDDISHAGDFATGLLLGQRPLDLPPKPSLLSSVGGLLKVDKKALAVIKAVRADQNMPRPFTVTRQPQIER